MQYSAFDAFQKLGNPNRAKGKLPESRAKREAPEIQCSICRGGGGVPGAWCLSTPPPPARIEGEARERAVQEKSGRGSASPSPEKFWNFKL